MSSKLSPLEINLHKMSNPVFCDKMKKKIYISNLSSAELAKRVAKV